MLVAGPETGIRVEKKAFLVFITDVAVEILSNRELTVKLHDKHNQRANFTINFDYATCVSPAREKPHSSRGTRSRHGEWQT